MKIYLTICIVLYVVIIMFAACMGNPLATATAALFGIQTFVCIEYYLASKTPPPPKIDDRRPIRHNTHQMRPDPPKNVPQRKVDIDTWV